MGTESRAIWDIKLRGRADGYIRSHGSCREGKLRESIESRMSPKFNFEQQGGGRCLSELGLIVDEHVWR